MPLIKKWNIRLPNTNALKGLVDTLFYFVCERFPPKLMGGPNLVDKTKLSPLFLHAHSKVFTLKLINRHEQGKIGNSTGRC